MTCFREIVSKGVGEDGDYDAHIFLENPRPILHAPGDIISRKGKCLTPTNIDLHKILQPHRIGEPSMTHKIHLINMASGKYTLIGNI